MEPQKPHSEKFLALLDLRAGREHLEWDLNNYSGPQEFDESVYWPGAPSLVLQRLEGSYQPKVPREDLGEEGQSAASGRGHTEEGPGQTLQLPMRSFSSACESN